MERLRFLREKRGLSQQDLADLIGSTQPTIHKYETGANQPDIQTLGLLADVFETSVIIWWNTRMFPIRSSRWSPSNSMRRRRR